MNVKRLDSFLNRLSLVFRRFFLDMRLSYDFSDNSEIAQVTISKISKGASVALVPSAIFVVSAKLVRFLKLDFSSELDFVEYEVSSFFELRTIVLFVVFSLIKAEHSDLSFYEFLSKILSSRVDSPEDFLEYLLKVNDIEFNRDPDFLYVYEYGNFSFYKDAISFFSSQSVRVIYKINTEFSAYSVLSLIFDSIYATLFPDRISDETQEVRIFKDETFEDPDAPLPTEEEGAEGFGGFGGAGEAGEGLGGGTGGGGSSSIPVEGGGSEMGGMPSGPGLEGA